MPHQSRPTGSLVGVGACLTVNSGRTLKSRKYIFGNDGNHMSVDKTLPNPSLLTRCCWTELLVCAGTPPWVPQTTGSQVPVIEAVEVGVHSDALFILVHQNLSLEPNFQKLSHFCAPLQPLLIWQWHHHLNFCLERDLKLRSSMTNCLMIVSATLLILVSLLMQLPYCPYGNFYSLNIGLFSLVLVVHLNYIWQHLQSHSKAPLFSSKWTWSPLISLGSQCACHQPVSPWWLFERPQKSLDN